MADRSENSASHGRQTSQHGDGPLIDTLRELLGIFTHDLNNPLQTLLVLSEIGVDESPPGSEARARAEQCLLAAQRLRSLSQTFAYLARNKAQPLAASCQRIPIILSRRLERCNASFESDLDNVPGNIVAAPVIELLLLASCIAALQATSTNPQANHALRVQATSFERGAIQMRVALYRLDGGQPDTLVSLPNSAVEHLTAMSRAPEDVAITYSDQGVHLAFTTSP